MTILNDQDAIRSIESLGGRVIEFPVQGEAHFEVQWQGREFGPMIATELFWFARGSLLATQPKAVQG